jgi:hypothetical protein
MLLKRGIIKRAKASIILNCQNRRLINVGLMNKKYIINYN